MNTNAFSLTPPYSTGNALQDFSAEVLSPQFLDAYLPGTHGDPAIKEEPGEETSPMEQRLPNGSGGDEQQNQQMYYAGGSQDPRMGQERFDRYSQQMMSTAPGGSMQTYTTEQQLASARTPEMHNGSPQVAPQQLTLEQQQALTAQRAAMMQRQYSSPVLTGRQQLNGNDQRSKSTQNLMGGVQQQQQRPQEVGGQAAAMNGGITTASQMAMNQGGFMSPTYAATHPTPNGQQQPTRPPSAQQLAQMQQLQQQQQYHQQQQGTSSQQQQLSMSMQINSQMTQMNIQVGNQTTSQQQQAMIQQQPQQYTQQQLQQLQPQQMQPGPSQQMHNPQQTVQQHLQQQGQQMTNGQYAAYQNQMQMGQGQMMPQQHMQMTEQQLQLEQQARLQQLQLRQRQHPHLSATPRSASMGSLPLGQQQPPQYPYGQNQGGGPRPNGMNPFTVNGTPVTSNWTMAYQTEMPPAFLNYYHPGKPHPYFDHTRRNLQYPYPIGVKEIGDKPGEPYTFGYLPDSIYYNPANDHRRGGKGSNNDANLPGPSTSKASPKKRGAGTTGGGAGSKKQRRTNSDTADDVRFAQPYPPNMTAQQQRMASTSTAMYATTGQGFEGFSQQHLQQQQLMMQQPTLQRQMSAPAYTGLAQSAQDAMQSARQQQAIANAQAQYAAQQQQQQQQPTTPGQMTIEGYQQSSNGEGMYSEMQWRGAYTQQAATSTAPSSQPVFRSPQSTPTAFNNGSQQPQQTQQPGSNEQMYWNQQQQ